MPPPGPDPMAGMEADMADAGHHHGPGPEGPGPEDPPPGTCLQVICLLHQKTTLVPVEMVCNSG